jgi:hypothetical protein
MIIRGGWMKIVINNCYGGFGLSEEALNKYEELTGKTKVYDFNIDRSDKVLLKVVEELGENANGYCAELKIVDIPEGTDWTIEEYDGNEWVAESHETWS